MEPKPIGKADGYYLAVVEKTIRRKGKAARPAG